jgi:cytochrome b pre-mRNA-processing protein 3
LSFLSRLFGNREDTLAPVRPLWHRVVEIAREKAWYADYGLADTVAGRFDAITLVLALVLLRMEKDEALMEPAVRLTELFIDDMDGQLRQTGLGDLVVGKHVGKLMGTLGGRLGALREVLAPDAASNVASNDGAALAEVIARNVTLIEGGDAARLVPAVRKLADTLAALSSEGLMAARIER